MDISTWDWGAVIASLITTIGALWIYYGWAKQKRMETLANEAQRVRNKIKSLLECFEIHSELKTYTFNISTNDLRKILNDIHESYEFITNKKFNLDILQSLTNYIEDFQENPKKDPITISNPKLYLLEQPETNDKIMELINKLNYLDHKLKPFALYKTSPTRMQG